MQFHCHAANIGEIARGWQQIIRERRIQQLGIRIIDHVIEKHSAQALHHRPEGLSVHDCRIDGPADVFHRDIVQDFDVAGPGVDRDMGGMGAVAISAFGVGKRASTLAASRPATAPKSGTAIGRRCAAVRNSHRFGATAELNSGGCADCWPKLLRVSRIAEPPMTTARE